MIYYVSSKLKYANMWRESGLKINSSWINGEEKIEGSKALTDMWDRYFGEIAGANAFVLYLAHDDKPKGCLLELGAAMMWEKNVYIVCDDPIFEIEKRIGTIVHHHSVVVLKDLKELPR